MKVTILGCGSSGGVPMITGDWGACDPANPKNRRRRASILVQIEGKNILIDTSPDLREQLLSVGVWDIDLVLYTHDHADHVGGIDDLRQIYNKTGRPIPAYADSVTSQTLKQRYGYILETIDPLYPAFMTIHEIEGDIHFEGIRIIPFPQNHGDKISIGYRFDNLAYSTDLISLPPSSYDILKNLDIWIVDCLRDEPHITHANYEHTMAMIAQVKPKQAILTHMTHNLDFDELSKRVPAGIEPAYDGMVLEI